MKKLIISMFILLSGCDFYDNSLKINNKSNIEIAVATSNNRDSIFFNNIAYYLYNIIEPDSTISLSKRGMLFKGAWPQYVEESPQKKMFIYIFAIDTLKKYQGKQTMYDLFNHGKYIKVFSLSQKQLDDLHWKVQFTN